MTIYFLTPDYNTPSGGVQIIYRHVDILNANHIPAFVLHRTMDHRCSWFENQTPVAYWDHSVQRRAYFKLRKYLQPNRQREIYLRGSKSLVIGPNDFLVLPEIYGPELAEIGPNVPKVILNQGCYLTFQGYPLDSKPIVPPYGHKDVKGVLINSEDGLRYLRYVFPNQAVTRFHLSIDPAIFFYQREKKRQICYTPRKNELVVRQVVNILKARNALKDFELLPFSELPHAKVAKLMQESAIFLNFGQYEGFGLPPAEAMACGCITVGYHAGGGQEFMKPQFSFPVPCGDVLSYVRTIENIIDTYDQEPERYSAMGKAASDYVLGTYTQQRETEDIVGFWRNMLKGRLS